MTHNCSVVDVGSDSVCLANGILLWRGGLSAGWLNWTFRVTWIRIPVATHMTAKKKIWNTCHIYLKCVLVGQDWNGIQTMWLIPQLTTVSPDCHCHLFLGHLFTISLCFRWLHFSQSCVNTTLFYLCGNSHCEEKKSIIRLSSPYNMDLHNWQEG